MASPAPAGGGGRALALGLLGPLAIIAIAYVLIVLGNAAIHIGPLDRAAFGWLVPVPLWSVSPVVAAYLWRRVGPLASVGTAALIAVVLASTATWLIYSGWSTTVCDFGLNRSNMEFLGEALPVGIVLGGGWAVIAFETRHLILRGHRREAAILGTIGGFALIFLAIGAAVLTNLFLPACNRPR